jgi:hypothetical protein
LPSKFDCNASDTQGSDADYMICLLLRKFALAFNFAVGLAARCRRDFLGKGKRAVFSTEPSIENRESC